VAKNVAQIMNCSPINFGLRIDICRAQAINRFGNDSDTSNDGILFICQVFEMFETKTTKVIANEFD